MDKNNKPKETSKKKLVLRRESIKALDSLNLELVAEFTSDNTCGPSGNQPQ